MVLVGGNAKEKVTACMRSAMQRITDHSSKLEYDIDKLKKFEKSLTYEDINNWFSEGNPVVRSYLTNYSFEHFEIGHPLRKICINIMLSKWFDRFIITSICANALFLAANDPFSSKHEVIFRSAEYIFNSIFFVELVIKLVTLGVFSYRSGYFRDPWNRLDFFVLAVSWTQILLDKDEVRNFSFLRVLRILKVVKTVNNVPGLRRLVKSLTNSLSQLISFSCLVLFLLLFFAIFGTQLFSGDMRLRCFPQNTFAIFGTAYDPERGLCALRTSARETGGATCPAPTPLCSAFYPSTNNPNKNENIYRNFDNTLNSLLQISTIITLEGWSEDMTDIMKTRGVYASLFFIALVIFGGFFVINIAVAVIYRSYADSSVDVKKKDRLVRQISVVDESDDEESEEGSDDGEDEESGSCASDSTSKCSGGGGEIIRRTNRSLIILIAATNPKKFSDSLLAFFNSTLYRKFKKKCNEIVSNIFFEVSLVILIFVNISVLVAQANGADGDVAAFVNTTNTVCSIFFAVELLLQIFASSMSVFFSNGFNVLDAFIVVLSIIDLCFTTDTSFSAFRALRAFRTLKLLRRSFSLQQLVYTISQSASGLGYFCFILVLFLFMGALSGMALFAGQLENTGTGYASHFSNSGMISNTRANYDTLFSSFLTTFQISTGEGWTKILYRMMSFRPVLGAFYCILIYITGYLLILKLFLAIVLDVFSHKWLDGNKSYFDALQENKDAKKFRTIGILIKEAVLNYIRKLTAEAKAVSEGLGTIKLINIASKRELGECNNYRNKSKWQGWSLGLYWNNLRGSKLLSDAGYREKIFQNIQFSTVTRGSRQFKDCFKGAELVDMLTDQKIVKSDMEALAMGQELLFRKQMTCVYIPPDEELLESDFNNTRSGYQRVTPSYHLGRRNITSYHLVKTKMKESKRFRRKFKKSLQSDPPFRDGRSLYTLRIKGEVMTEHLQQVEADEPLLLAEEKKEKLGEMLDGKSFQCFDSESKFRRSCAELVYNKYFEYLVLLVIFFSSVLLAIDEPGVDSASDLGRFLAHADIFFLSFFVFEMIVKLVALGVIGTKNAYLTNYWNILDFLVVVLSILSISLASSDISSIRLLRSLRALQPLRVLSRSPGLRAIVTAVTTIIEPIINFSVVVFVVMIAFSIFGTSMFRGMLNYCHAKKIEHLDYNDTIVDIAEFKYVFDQVNCSGRVFNSEGFEVSLHWETVPSNFESVRNAFMTLFELITLDNWPGIMYPTMDIPDMPGMHPALNNSKWSALFFVIFIIFGSIFMTYLFVGITVFKFNQAREMERTSEPFLTLVQQVWLENIESVIFKIPERFVKPPSDRSLYGLQLPIWKLTRNPYFCLTMDTLIVLNIIVISTEYFNEPEASLKAHSILNIFFIFIFVIEILLRLAAVGFSSFCTKFWNRFDALIIIGGVVEVSNISLPFNVTIFRLLRVTKILKILYASNDFKILIRTLLFSLSSLLNITALLFLLIFIFAVIGMNLYGDAKIDGEVFNAYQNFGHFGTSMLLLFRCTTGESWGAVMHILRDANYPFTFPYFAGYLFLSNFVILNLYIAVILESYDNALHTEHYKNQRYNLEDFCNEWTSICSELRFSSHRIETSTLPSYCLAKILSNVASPLGLKDHSDAKSVASNANSTFFIQYINSLMLQQDLSGQVYFIDVIYALLRAADKNTNPSGNYTFFSMQQKCDFLRKLCLIYNKRVVNILKKKLKHETFVPIDACRQFICASVIQKCFRSWRIKQRFSRTFFEHSEKSDRILTGFHPSGGNISSVLAFDTSSDSDFDSSDESLSSSSCCSSSCSDSDSSGSYNSSSDESIPHIFLSRGIRKYSSTQRMNSMDHVRDIIIEEKHVMISSIDDAWEEFISPLSYDKDKDEHNEIELSSLPFPNTSLGENFGGINDNKSPLLRKKSRTEFNSVSF